MKFIISVVVFSLAATCGRAADPTHGCNVGDVTTSKATVWSRADANSTMTAVIYECGSDYTESNSVGETEVDSTNDYTGLVDITGLSHRTCYEARVTFVEEDGSVGSAAYATFYTAPRPENTRAVRFAWVGDVSGQNVCRDADEGFPLTDAMLYQRQLDFFLNVGDAIYGDAYCYEEGLGGNTQVEGDFIRSADLENYWAHWKYNLADEDYQTFLSKQAFFMTWDDHEVINDFGPGYDTRDGYPYTAGESLMPIGMQAFLNYNPIRATSDPAEQLDFYRKVRWGKYVELFILDCRQYRSLPTDTDTLANPKTMLGEEQLAWLYESLLDSTALWKIIVTSVPLSIPTGTSDAARDGWANFEGDTGYEIELEEILRFLSNNNMYNTVFITADVHFAQVLQYQPFLNDPDFVFHEIVVGPMNAAPFNFDDLDDSFNPERLFMYAPDLNALSGAYTYDELKEYFNFGLAEIDTDGDLTFSVIANSNEVVYNITLSPHED